MTAKPRRHAQRTNITLPPRTKEWAEAYADEQDCYGSLSALIRSLLEQERQKVSARQTDAELLAAAAEQAAPYEAKPAPKPAAKTSPSPRSAKGKKR